MWARNTMPWVIAKKRKPMKVFMLVMLMNGHCCLWNVKCTYVLYFYNQWRLLFLDFITGKDELEWTTKWLFVLWCWGCIQLFNLLPRRSSFDRNCCQVYCSQSHHRIHNFWKCSCSHGRGSQPKSQKFYPLSHCQSSCCWSSPWYNSASFLSCFWNHWEVSHHDVILSTCIKVKVMLGTQNFTFLKLTWILMWVFYQN